MKKLTRHLHRALAPALAISLLIGGVAQAANLRVATGFPPNSVGAHAAQAFADSLKEYSEGEHSGRVYAMSLLSFQEASSGVRDGVVDVGVVLLQYFSNEFPASSLAGEISLLLTAVGADPAVAGPAFSGAISEFVLTQCPQCLNEMKAQNQISLGIAGSPPYMLQCNTPVVTAADLKGKRIRVAGGQWARWAQAMGATPVTLSASDTYEGLSQGIVDCSAQNAGDLVTFKHEEVVTNITPAIPGGVFGSVGHNMNLGAWKKLDEDGRRAVLRAAADMMGTFNYLAEQDAKRAMERVAARGIKLHEADDDVIKATAEFTERDIAAIAKTYEQKFGVKNAEQVLAEFRPLLDRWLERLSSVDSAEQLSQLYWQEIFSKVDVNTYGQ